MPSAWGLFPVTGTVLARAALRGDPESACDFTTEEISPLSWIVHDFLRGLSEESPVVFLHDLICADGRCRTGIGDIFMYRDAGHLSIEAARFLGEERAFFLRIERAASEAGPP